MDTLAHRIVAARNTRRTSRTPHLLAAAAVAALLTACAAALPQSADQQADAARAQAQRAAEQNAARTAEKARSDRAQAERDMVERIRAEEAAQRAQASVVARVEGPSEAMAHALTSSMRGAVSAVSLGNSVVITGAPQDVERAQHLLSELNAHAAADFREQEMEMERSRKQQEEAIAMNRAAMERIIDVKFGPTLSASLENLSKALEEHDGPGLNVVIANAGTSNPTIRDVVLQRVSLPSALKTLQTMVVNSEGEPLVRIELSPVTRNEERPVVTVRPSPAQARETGSYQLAVFRLDPLNDYTDKDDRARIEQQHATMLDAIDVGLEIVGRSPEFKIKLHPATGMMFVHGTRNELRVVAEVLGQGMPDGIETPSPDLPVAPPASPAAKPAPASTPAPPAKPSAR